MGVMMDNEGMVMKGKDAIEHPATDDLVINVIEASIHSHRALRNILVMLYQSGYRRGAQDKYVEMTTKTSDGLEANT